ncbi:AI-2E family transporter [Ferrimonas pelagia]|uniref:AI-2E family transporter n=1 Tax=Ferrimonas pelagia TaxID=1177826 RepID=A0ABP9FEI8_9GAMM
MVPSPFNQASVALRTTLMLAALVVIFAGIKAASTIVVPFLLAMFMAIICSPLVNLLMRAYLPRWLAILAVIALILLVSVWLGAVVGSSAADFRSQLPMYREQLTGQFQPLVDLLAQFNVHLSVEQIREQFDPSRAMSLATDILSGVGNLMANTLLIVLTVVFMLLEASGVNRKLHYALDDPEMRVNQIDRFIESVNRYLAIKTLVSLATGVFCGFGLYLIGVDYYLLWGLLAFLLNYIPNIGSFIAAIPAVALALLQFGPGGAAAAGGVFVAANMVMGNVIEPRLMGRTLGLSTLVVFLSLIFWGWLLGSVGMLLSVPLTMIVKIGLESSNDGRWLAVLLEGEPSPTKTLSDDDTAEERV